MVEEPERLWATVYKSNAQSIYIYIYRDEMPVDFLSFRAFEFVYFGLEE